MNPPLSAFVKRMVRLARRELPLLVAIMVIAGGLWAFVGISEEVIEGEIRAVDEAVLLALRTPADRGDPLDPSWVEELARDATAFGNRDARYLLNIRGTWLDPAEDARHTTWVSEFWTAMERNARGGHYANFVGHAVDKEALAQARASSPPATRRPWPMASPKAACWPRCLDFLRLSALSAPSWVCSLVCRA